jgi:DNA-binding transcriptional LysR family regulator
VDAGGFTAAARRLGVSKQVLSRHVAALEEELGVRLLERSTRSLRLTEAGARFHEHARALTESARAAEHAARAAQERPSGLLRITTSPVFGEAFLGEVVHRYLLRWPDAGVHLLLTERREPLIEGNIDLAIRFGPLVDSAFVARRLAPARTVCCAAPRYLEAAPPLVEPADLGRHAALVYGRVAERTDWRFRKGTEEQRAEVSGRLVVNSVRVALDAALSGLGILLAPAFVCGPHLTSGALVSVLPGWSPIESAVYAVYPSRSHLSANLRAMLAMIEEHLSRSPLV